jgi:hypothetical protein
MPAWLGIAIVSTAQADIIYVDVDCPGTGNGSEAEPYCSIQTAIDKAVDTDEIVVAPGTYLETIDFLGKAIWLHSSDGAEVTTVDAQQAGTVVTGFSGTRPATVLEGFTITGGNHGIRILWSPTITNCSFIGNAGAGMFISGGNPTVTGCTFQDNSGTGVSVESGAGLFVACTFRNNLGTGLSTHHDDDNCNGDSPITLFAPLLLNCLFAGNNGYGVKNFTSSVAMVNCTFSGNTLGAMGNLGVACPGGGCLQASTTATNCILWENGGYEITNTCSSPPTVTNSLVKGGWPGTGNIDTDPMFVDPDNGDYRLQAGSHCIDAGLNVCTEQDLDGNERFADDPETPDCQQEPGTCGERPIVDMGAYEFNSRPADALSDCNANGIWDAFEIIKGFADDCNLNCVPDTCDIADLTSLDCNFDSIPDECQVDCNSNLVPDDCDIAAGTSLDDNCDGVPDECEPSTCLADCEAVPDGDIGLNDFFALLGQWAQIGTSCDFGCDGVGINDLLDLLANWGPCP